MSGYAGSTYAETPYAGAATATAPTLVSLAATLASTSALTATLGGGTSPAVLLAASLASSSALAADLSFVGIEQASTDTTNLGNGRNRVGSGEDHSLYPVKPLPAHLTVTKHRIMAQQMPAPVLVDGKPT